MKTRTLFAALVALTASMALAGQASMHDMPGMKGTAPKKQSSKANKTAQKVTVTVDNGFTPSSITVKAGKPVQLTFNTKHKGCAATVVFKSLNITKSLTDGKMTVVTFTPRKAGTIVFACGMGMYKGSVVVK